MTTTTTQNYVILDQIAEYMDYCKFVRQMSVQTLSNKSYTYQQFFNQTGCDDLMELDNKTFNNWIAIQSISGVSARTINTRVANLIALLRYHKEMGVELKIKIPLIKKLKTTPPKRTYYFSEDIAKVLKCADNPMDWLIIRISFDVGLRISELASLRLENLEGRKISYIGKGGKYRKTYISTEAYDKLLEWISYAGVTDWLWINEFHKRVQKDALRIRMKLVFQKAGYDNFYPHALRHSMCTDALLHGATEREAQQLMGHSNLATTQVYSHDLEDKERELSDRFRNYSLA